MGEPFVLEKRLAELIELNSKFPRQMRFERIGHKLTERHETEQNLVPLDKIRHFTQALASGALPDASTLTYIVVGFERYVQGEGTLTLDEAFRLKSIPKAGNPARQYARQNHINSKLFDMAWMRAYDANLPIISIEAAAMAVCEDPDLKEIGTLVRQYKRGKWTKIEGLLRGK